jgi:hypothetical protein
MRKAQQSRDSGTYHNNFPDLAAFKLSMHVVTLHLSKSGKLQWHIHFQEYFRGDSTNNPLPLQELQTYSPEDSKSIQHLDEVTRLVKVGLTHDLAKIPSRSGPLLPLLLLDLELTF